MTMTRPRILIFSLAYFPFVGGAEVAIKEITDRLTDFDFDLITVNLDGAQLAQEMIGRVMVYRLGCGKTLDKYLFPWQAVKLAEQLHHSHRYQIVWSMMANQAGMAGAKFKRKFPDTKFLLSLQEGDDLDSLIYKSRLLGTKFLGVFKAPDQIQAISNYLARWARKMGANCPVAVIPNGVDLTKFVSEIKTKKDLENSESNSEKIVITTSRLVKKNGLDLLIKALAFLPADVKLQILGTGPEEKALKQLANSLNLVARVSFLGQVKSSLVGQSLSRARIFVRPSRSEGLGNSFLEAMATGLPVVATPVGGIPDFLLHGETGWFCRIEDSESIADQIKYILNPNNRAEVTKVIADAQKMVKENYDWDKIVLRFSELLKF